MPELGRGSACIALKMENDAVREVFAELNRPSAQRLKQVLRQRGIPFDAATVDAVVSRSTEKQQQAPAYKYTGNIVSTGVNARWAMDTINLTSRPSKGQRYVVVAQDIFTRRVFAKASPSAPASLRRRWGRSSSPSWRSTACPKS